jgi:uncharacterized protein
METSPDLQKVILRVLVGSHAYGLARIDSDHNYREVFVYPTSTMLSLGKPPLKFGWMNENRHTDDEGGTEIGQWLTQCAKGSPNAWELVFAPLHAPTDWDPNDLRATDWYVEARTIQEMGRALLTFAEVQRGVLGYAMNSWRKIPERPTKWKVGMLRVLFQGHHLLTTGQLDLNVETLSRPQREALTMAAANELTDGQVLDVAEVWRSRIEMITDGGRGLPTNPNWATVNQWLLRKRREDWWV